MSKKTKYDDAILKLRAILDSLQSDDISIDDLGKSIKEADLLIKQCKDKLKGIENEIELIRGSD